MKTILKFAALGVVSLSLAGCNEDNDKVAIKPPEGGKGASGQVDPKAPKSSSDAYKQQQANDPTKSPDYMKQTSGR